MIHSNGIRASTSASYGLYKRSQHFRKVAIKNSKGEPVACIALDIDARGLAAGLGPGRFRHDACPGSVVGVQWRLPDSALFLG